jgi:hypothetical protein
MGNNQTSSPNEATVRLLRARPLRYVRWAHPTSINPSLLPAIYRAEQLIRELDSLCDEVSQAMLLCLDAHTFMEDEILGLVHKLQAVDSHAEKMKKEQLSTVDLIDADWPNTLVALSLANVFSNDLDVLGMDTRELLELFIPTESQVGKFQTFMPLTDEQAIQAAAFLDQQKLAWSQREPRMWLSPQPVAGPADGTHDFVESAMKEFAAEHETKTVEAALSDFETLLYRLHVPSEDQTEDEAATQAAQAGVAKWGEQFDKLATHLDLQPGLPALEQAVAHSFARQRVHLLALTQGQASKFEFQSIPEERQVRKALYTEVHRRLGQKHDGLEHEVQIVRKLHEVVTAAFTFETKEEWLEAFGPRLNLPWFASLADFQSQAADIVAKEGAKLDDPIDKLVHRMILNDANLSCALFPGAPRAHFFLIEIFADEIRTTFEVMRTSLRTRVIGAAFMLTTSNRKLATKKFLKKPL